MSRRSIRGSGWRHFRHAFIKVRGRRCERCGGRGRLEVHHKVPLAEGGAKWDVSNLEILCRRCHFDEHRPVADPERQEWLAFVED